MIAVDWGSTHVRAYLLDAGGAIRERKFAAAGAMLIDSGQFAAALEELIRPWIERGEGPILMSGMVGSREGWMEVPYVSCPASLEDVAHGVARVQWGDGRCAFIVPGVSCVGASGVPDVMRGEETQALGTIPALPSGPVSLCLPGTHSKHLNLHDGVLQGFMTYMTGELYSVMRRHSILGRSMDMARCDIDPTAFRAGVERACGPGELSHHLFGVRTRVLSGEVKFGDADSYLSGILIGHEIRAAQPDHPIFIIGSGSLGRLYMQAFEQRGIHASLVDSDVAATGLYRIGRLLTETMP